jgi:N6-L-threonylcarbamoyladenine synthase
MGKPIVGVHHMVRHFLYVTTFLGSLINTQRAHALTAELTNADAFRGYPFLTLLISGGHTMILLATSCQNFKILASSVDVAIGNAFDKVARMLDIAPDPGKGYGAALEVVCNAKYPEEGVAAPPNHPFPPLAYNLPNRLQPELFSFTGLISAVQRVVESKQLDDHRRWVLARAFENAAFSQLELKLQGALDWCEENGIQPKSLVVSGGVASNMSLRQR